MSAKFLLTKRRSFTGPTEAPNTLPVIRNNTPECVADTCAAGRPQEEAWESLALASSFRPRLLADRCGVSLRTLERHFTKHYRLTVGKSLRKMRLNLGYKRLMHGERIKQVAYDLGYKQLSHFSRDFKRFYGVPPRALQCGLLFVDSSRLAAGNPSYDESNAPSLGKTIFPYELISYCDG